MGDRERAFRSQPAAPAAAKRDAPVERGAAADPAYGHRFDRVPACADRLPPDVEAKMEGAFRTSFADVRVASAPPSGAAASARGSTIAFAPGRYRPDTPSGQALIGHELAHLVQQRAGRVAATGVHGGVRVNDDPRLEREASTLGLRAAASPVPDAPPPVEPAPPAAPSSVAQLAILTWSAMRNQWEAMHGVRSAEQPPIEGTYDGQRYNTETKGYSIRMVMGSGSGGGSSVSGGGSSGGGSGTGSAPATPMAPASGFDADAHSTTKSAYHAPSPHSKAAALTPYHGAAAAAHAHKVALMTSAAHAPTAVAALPNAQSSSSSGSGSSSSSRSNLGSALSATNTAAAAAAAAPTTAALTSHSASANTSSAAAATAAATAPAGRPATAALGPALAAAARDNTAVPDLPQLWVTRIEAAKAQEDARAALVTSLGQYLEGLVLHADLVGQIQWHYESKGTDYGVSGLRTDDKQGGGSITIFGRAFASAPVLYSTMRHELIHLEQSRQSPESKTDSKDDFIYQNLTLGALPRAFLHAASEIETHWWEIMNLQLTGGDAAFRAERWTALNNHWTGLMNIARDRHLNPGNYAGYYLKARGYYVAAAVAAGKTVNPPATLAAAQGR